MATMSMESTVAAEKPKTLSVKIEVDVIESARIVAALRGESMTELLGSILRPALAKMEKEGLAKRLKKGKAGEAGE